jgi:hypothetical protein
MTSDGKLDRALAAISAALNDRQLEHYQAPRVQEIGKETLRGELRLTVDDGGGLHDESGRRVGAIRRTPSGEWIVDRQNPLADRSNAPIPTQTR